MDNNNLESASDSVAGIVVDDDKYVGLPCWIKVLKPNSSSDLQDSMEFVIIGVSGHNFIVVFKGLSPDKSWMIKKSEVVFEDRIFKTVPKKFLKS
jgi:hypothetical protein